MIAAAALRLVAYLTVIGKTSNISFRIRCRKHCATVDGTVQKKGYNSFYRKTGHKNATSS